MSNLVANSGGAATGSDPNYQIHQDIWISANDTLTIPAGSVITSDDGGTWPGLGIIGKLIARGTPAQPIIFTSGDARGASGDLDYALEIQSGPSRQSVIEWVVFEKADIGVAAWNSVLAFSNCTAQTCNRGMYLDNCSSLLDGCVIRNNGPAWGAGVYAFHGTPTFKNSMIIFNATSTNTSSYAGGGIAMSYTSGALIDNCRIAHNHAQFGGGVILYGCTNATIKGSDISLNDFIEWEQDWNGIDIEIEMGASVTLKQNRNLGLLFYYKTTGQIINNDFGSRSQLAVKDCSPLVAHNIFRAIYDYNTKCWDNAKPNIANNIFLNDNIIVEKSTTGDPVVRNNCFVGTTNELYFNENTNWLTIGQLNALAGNSGNFQIVDAGLNVAQTELLRTSLCLDAGIDVGVTNDYYGRLRPVDGNGDSSTKPDVGPYELFASGIDVSGNLDFGMVATGAVATASMTIANIGIVPLLVTNISCPPGFSGVWTGTVEAGKATNVTVSFAPLALQNYGGTITVQSDAAGGANTISCSGEGAGSIIGVSGNLAFGTIPAGASKTLVMTITNLGVVPLTVANIEFPSAFGGIWTGTLTAGHATNIGISFTPPAIGSFDGTIVVQSDAICGTNTIACSGSGGDPASVLTNFTVTPLVGLTNFTYVLQIDARDSWGLPVQPVLHLDDATHPMALVSGNTSSGRWSATIGGLGLGTHSAHLTMTDSSGNNLYYPRRGDFLLTFPCPVVSPMLVQSSVKVSPGAYGFTNTMFRLSVDYRHPLGLAPASARVFVSGQPYDLSLTSGVANDGQYALETHLPVGTQTYYFAFIDTAGNQEYQSAPGVLSNLIVRPHSGIITNFVSKVGAHISPFDNWEKAATNIQDAVDILPTDSRSVIMVGPGRYDSQNAKTKLSGLDTWGKSAVWAEKPVDIIAVDGPRYTLVDGLGTARCFLLASNASISGFTLTNGVAGNPESPPGAITKNFVWETYTWWWTYRSWRNYSFGGGVMGLGGGTVSNCIVRQCKSLGNQSGMLHKVDAFNTLVIDSLGDGCVSSRLFNCTAALSSGIGLRDSQAYNTIVWSNAVDYANSTFSNSCAFPLPSGSGNISTNPRFSDLAAWDFRLSPESPCIDAGNDGFAPAGLDLNGAPRINGTHVDMGCFEHSPVDATYVSTNGLGLYPYGTWETAAYNIQDAINALPPSGGTVWIGPGTYTGTGNRDIDFGSRILNIIGVDGPSNTVIDCESAGAGFIITSNMTARSLISDLTIEKSSGGYAVSIQSASVIVENCRILNSIGYGSIYAGQSEIYVLNNIITNCGYLNFYNSTGSINSCYFESNTGGFAGAGAVRLYNAKAVITNSYFYNNGGDNSRSGALSISGGNVQVVDSIFKGNRCGTYEDSDSSYQGGAISMDAGYILNCDIISNRAANGAGVYARGNSRIENCRIQNNVTTYWLGGVGGGCYLDGENVVLKGCLIEGNRQFDNDGVDGAGVFMHYSTIDSCVIRNNDGGMKPGGVNVSAGILRNTLIEGNISAHTSALRAGGAYYGNMTRVINCTIIGDSNSTVAVATSGSGALDVVNSIIVGSQSAIGAFTGTVNYSCLSTNWPGEGNIQADPLFGEGYRLSSSSPCINAGTNQLEQEWELDLDGFPRVVVGCVDMGAYERDGNLNVRIIHLSGNLDFGVMPTGAVAFAAMTIANTGLFPFAVTNIACTEGFSGAWMGSVAPGTATNVPICFAPTVAQSYNGSITVQSDAAAGVNIIPCSGTGRAAVIGVSGNLVFDAVPTGAVATAAMTITNSGYHPFAVTNIDCPEGFSGAWTGSVAAGTATNVPICFAPLAVQSYGGTITVQSDAAGGTNTLDCSGTGRAAVIGIYGNLHFGQLATGSVVSATMTIRNSGFFPFTVTNIAYPEGFRGAWTGAVAAGSAVHVTVSFAPVAVQSYGGTITVQSDAAGGTNTLDCSGIGALQNCYQLPVDANRFEGGRWQYNNYQGTWFPAVQTGEAVMVSTDTSWGQLHTVSTGFLGETVGFMVNPSLQSGGSNADGGRIGFGDNWPNYSGLRFVGLEFKNGLISLIDRPSGYQTNLAPFAAQQWIEMSLTLTTDRVMQVAGPGFSYAYAITGSVPTAWRFCMAVFDTTDGFRIKDLCIHDAGASLQAINLFGNLAFGNVETGAVATATMTITNSGFHPFAVTNIVYPEGFSGAWTGAVAAGSAVHVTVSFAPVAVQSYGGTITVQSDAAGGVHTISCSGAGIIPTKALNILSRHPWFGTNNIGAPQGAGIYPLGSPVTVTIDRYIPDAENPDRRLRIVLPPEIENQP